MDGELPLKLLLLKMSLTKTAYHQLEAVGNGGHVFVNPISVKADVHFASGAEDGSEDEGGGSDYHTGQSLRSANDDLELVKLKQISGNGHGGRRVLLADSGRLLSSSSNYSVSSYSDVR